MTTTEIPTDYIPQQTELPDEAMKQAEAMDAPEVQALKERIPLYPEPLLEKNEEHDIPSYTGNLDDLTERRNVKLYNLWSIWSDLRGNEKLIKLLEVSKKDTVELKYLKAMMTLTLDRMGKVLSDTNIIEELCVREEKRSDWKETAPEFAPGGTGWNGQIAEAPL